MRAFKKWTAAALCLTLVLAAGLFSGTASADDTAATIKPFAKNGMLGASIVFSEEDFTGNVISKGSFTGILIASVPAEADGTFLCSGQALSAGSVVDRASLSKITFVPQSDHALSARLDFLPIQKVKSGEISGQQTYVTVNLRTHYNFTPSAANLLLETYKDMPIEISLSAYDYEGDPLTYTVVSSPEKGSVSTADGKLIFTPAAGKTGKITFSYFAQDALGNTSDLATVTVKVNKQKSGYHYTDLKGSTLQYSAVRLAEAGGYAGEVVGNERLFYPDKAVTRGEFITMLTALFDLPLTSSVSSVITDTLGWQSTYIAAALDSGLINTIRADDGITAAEAATLVSRILGGAVTAAATPDIQPAWAAADVYSVHVYGVLRDMDDLNRTLTRAEAADLLTRALAVKSGSRLGWAIYS